MVGSRRVPPHRTALLLCAALCAACGEGVPILMYHSVSGGGEPLTVAPHELDAQLDYLGSAGFETITLRELLDAQDGATRVAPGHRRYLVWPEVRALKDAGMEIGSHSVSHRKLVGLHKADLRAEIEQSRAALQANLGQRIEFFAYPYNDQMQWVRRAVERAGYRGAVVGARGNSDPFTLQRLTMHRGISAADLRSMLSETWETAYTGGG